MKLYFCNSRNEMRVIAEIHPRTDDRMEVYSTALAEIHRFCDSHNFHVYYVRTWEEERGGQRMLAFDVGSHTEFFYVAYNTD